MSGISRIRRSGLAPVPFFEIDPLIAYLLPGTLNFSRTPNAIWSGGSFGNKSASDRLLSKFKSWIRRGKSRSLYRFCRLSFRQDSKIVYVGLVIVGAALSDGRIQRSASRSQQRLHATPMRRGAPRPRSSKNHSLPLLPFP